MTTKSGKGFCPQLKPIRNGPDIAAEIEWALKAAPKERVVKMVEIFVKALNLAPKLVANILIAAWCKCSELQYVIKDQVIAGLTAIYKKGDKSGTSNYRPRAVLSHVRKLLDSAVAKTICKSYKLKECQLGFQPRTGIEAAIVIYVSEAK